MKAPTTLTTNELFTSEVVSIFETSFNVVKTFSIEIYFNTAACAELRRQLQLGEKLKNIKIKTEDMYK